MESLLPPPLSGLHRDETGGHSEQKGSGCENQAERFFKTSLCGWIFAETSSIPQAIGLQNAFSLLLNTVGIGGIEQGPPKFMCTRPCPCDLTWKQCPCRCNELWSPVG